jgi:hypothetical protein
MGVATLIALVAGNRPAEAYHLKCYGSQIDYQEKQRCEVLDKLSHQSEQTTAPAQPAPQLPSMPSSTPPRSGGNALEWVLAHRFVTLLLVGAVIGVGGVLWELVEKS